MEQRLFREVGGTAGSTSSRRTWTCILRLSLVEDLCRVQTPVCAYSEGIEGSATQRERCSEFLFRAYEDIFDRPESLPRVLASAGTPHLCGKTLRHYLISTKKALRRSDFSALWRRLRDASALVVRSGRKVVMSEFWRAVVSRQAGVKP